MAETTNYGPKYYKRGSIDVWDFIRQQDLGFHLGNAVKYISRAGYKDDDIADLNKAIHYLQNEVEHRTSQRVSESIQCSKLTDIEITEYAETFDR